MRWIDAARWILRKSLPPSEADAVLGDLLEEVHHHRKPRRVLLDACSIGLHALLQGRARPHTTAKRTNPIMETLAMDLRYAVRSLAKRPSFPIVVLTTLALGIGAATAIFSIVEAILLRPLPFHDPDRLVFVNETDDIVGRMGFAWPNYEDYRDRARSLESLACHQGNAFSIVGDGHPRRVPGRLVCAPFFDVLGVRMQMGRTFTAADDQPGAHAVAVVSDTFWHQDLGGDPAVLGRTLRTSDTTLTIVGVLPPGFTFARAEHVFVPLGIVRTKDSGYYDRGNHSNLTAVGRLKAGMSLRHANEEIGRIFADLRRDYPNTNARTGGEAALLRDRLVDQVRDTLVALMGAVSFLLLLACVNVSNLLVARGAARQHELAIRTALGGTRWRIVRQLLAESMLLSIGGAALGAIVAVALLKMLVALAPEGTPRIEGVSINQVSLLFALGAAIASGLLFGVFPALQVSGGGGQLLAQASRTSGALAPRRSRRALMVVEVALALVLLVGCGLMARTMLRLHAVDPGFRAEHLLTARIILSGPSWNDAAKRASFVEQVLEKVRAIPGIQSAAVTLSLPIEGSNWGSVFIARDKPVPPRAELPTSAWVPVSAGYFRTLGMQVREGREFDPGDSAQAENVVVVNETFARRMWPGERAVGKQVKQGWPETPDNIAPWRRVVGVVNDVKLNGIDQATPMQAFLPYAQNASRSVALVARTAVEPATLGKAVEAAVHALNRELPVTRILPMAQLISDSVARRRLSTVILAVFALVAVILAAVGLYGVVSHGVIERTREIGVRMALGAERGRVLRLFLLQGVRTAAAGTVVGLSGAFLLSKWMSALLFQVTPTDPATFAGVAVLLLVVAAIACYIPARRAARMDPLAALRVE